jgi:nodulation protein Z
MKGYVVSRPFPDSNVGSNLSSLAGAAWLARRLNRTLVVDWRGMSQLRNPSLNYFTEFFERADRLLGVPVVYAPDVEIEIDPAGGEVEWASPDQARAIAQGDRPLTADVLVLQPYHGLDRLHSGTESDRLGALRSFYREIHPEATIAATIDAWWQNEYDGAFVIGVNVRTGNGHYFGDGQAYVGRVDIRIFRNEKRFIRALERAVAERARLVPKQYRSGFRVFYATDSPGMSDILSQLPGASTRRRVFPPPGTGDTHAFDDDETAHAAIVDTIADMFLLARCDALVYNNSLFNQYARVLTGQFSGNQVHIESLFLHKRLEAAATRLRARR